jgi:two-component system cell cycle sensor histidine kinase/response regulator CckA
MTPHRARPGVLVVDDEPHILSSMTALLEEDFAVVTSTNAEAALSLLKDVEIAVIVADQRMPGLNGDEFLARAKELSEATRILITGYADINALIRAVNHGQIYTYVAKPWEPSQLKVTVAKAAEYWLLMKQMERERDLLHGLMDNIPDAIWFKDTGGRYTQVNKTAASFLGVSDPSVVAGKSAFDFFPVDEAREIQAEEETIVRLERAASNRIQKLHWNDGVTRWMSTTKAPILERNHEVAALVGVARDVTEQKDAELALYESEKRYRQIVETAAEGVWIFDERLRTVFVNSKMAAMLGCVPEEMNGTDVAGFMMDEDKTAQLEEFDQHNSNRRAADVRLRKKDGSVIWAILATSPMLDSTGQRTGTLAMLTDVTERKVLEEQYRQAQKMEAVGQLAGGIAHDFNNVLNVIIGYSKLLLEESTPRDPAYRRFEAIRKAGEQAAALTQQLLAFSRKQVLQPRVVNLADTLNDMDHMVRRLIGENIEVVTTVHDHLAPVKIDPSQVQQVILNLIVNARDAMPNGGVLTIELMNSEMDESSARHHNIPAGGYVMLAVSDNGSGMTPEVQQRVFEPFFTTKEVGRGTGLGLATVYGIVKQSGGYIWLYSELGFGTTFKIFLPRLDEPRESAPNEPVQEISRGKETILVVEDDPIIRSLVHEILSPVGYNVILAESGDRALRTSEQCAGEIHLLMTDVVLPKMGGREIASRLVALRPGIEVLFTSGYTGYAMTQRGALEPGVNFLPKPFSPEGLRAKVRAVLTSRSSPQRILVVDDEAPMRDLLREILERAGFQVHTASGGREAREHAQRHPVDVVITDLAMPEEEGLEMIRTVRKEHRDFKIIAMSGAFGDEILQAARLLGADATLAKPITEEMLLQCISKVSMPRPS